ncbi:right-handed parallel beta-helix repeat-containing protein [bacterium]|nr:right-handed parallel beta-helix repeat-containing protein [bacterium]
MQTSSLFLNKRLLTKTAFFAILVVCGCIFLPAVVWGATYYVKNGGNNELDGLSDATAWETINQVNSYNFEIGADVYFKCGGTWNKQTLNVDWHGTESNRVVIGAYYMSGGNEVFGVNGNKPIIEGIPRPNDDNNETNCYPVNRNDSLVKITGDFVTLQNIKVHHSGGRGIAVLNGGGINYPISNVNVNNCIMDYCQMSGIIVFNLAIGEITNNIIVNVSRMALNPVNGNWPAALVTHSGSRNLKINNNTVHSNHGEGIQTYSWAHDLIIEDNVLYENAKAGFNITGSYPPSTNTSYNLVIRKNLIYGTTDPVYHRGDGPSAAIYINDASNDSVYNIEIYNNLIAYCSSAFFLASAQADCLHDVQIYNNTIVACDYCFNSVGGNRCFNNVEIKNNICDQWQIAACRIDNPEPGLDWSNNLWSSHPNNSECSGTGDIIAIPLLTKATDWYSITGGALTGHEFTLQSASPAKNKGANLGSPYDQGLNPSSVWPNNVSTLDQDNYGSDWEIGAFVFLKGDLTGDGSINIQDVQACVNHILGRQDWGENANVNGDGVVNILDVQEIVNVIMGG